MMEQIQYAWETDSSGDLSSGPEGTSATLAEAKQQAASAADKLIAGCAAIFKETSEDNFWSWTTDFKRSWDYPWTNEPDGWREEGVGCHG